MMKRKKFIIPIVIAGLIVVALLFGKIIYNVTTAVHVKDPFSVSLVYAKVGFEKNAETGENERRLLISTKIENNTNEILRDVNYTISLNKEVQPYIGSGLTEYNYNNSYVFYPDEKAKEKSRDNGKSFVIDITDKNSMFLTTQDKLKKYYNLEPDGIYKAFTSIEVNLKWNGGSQVVSLPVELTNEE